MEKNYFFFVQNESFFLHALHESMDLGFFFLFALASFLLRQFLSFFLIDFFNGSRLVGRFGENFILRYFFLLFCNFEN